MKSETAEFEEVEIPYFWHRDMKSPKTNRKVVRWKWK